MNQNTKDQIEDLLNTAANLAESDPMSHELRKALKKFADAFTLDDKYKRGFYSY